MKTRLLTVILFLACFSCNTGREELAEKEAGTAEPEMAFDKTKWEAKEGKDYPFRERMLNDILYGDTVRSQTKDGVLDLLGKPDRINENYLYYMVIKLSANNTVEWIRIHD